MQDAIKIASTLADETRFSIYEYMLRTKKYVNVQDIADQFHIHANVARLHLTKLAEIQLIFAEFQKTGKGGRPGRVYRVNEQGIQLSFPRREPNSLLKWCLQLISELGEEALVHIKAISYKDGWQTMRDASTAKRNKRPLTFDEKVTLLTNSASLIGYIPEIRAHGHEKSLHFSIYNCPFQEQIAVHGQVICEIHESYLRGQVDALFEHNEFAQIDSILHRCDFCNYKIDVHN